MILTSGRLVGVDIFRFFAAVAAAAALYAVVQARATGGELKSIDKSLTQSLTEMKGIASSLEATVGKLDKLDGPMAETSDAVGKNLELSIRLRDEERVREEWGRCQRVRALIYANAKRHANRSQYLGSGYAEGFL